ncbi:MAG: phosphate--AMP phosphotransferase, partial [Lachnospiraceae bacterium]|nr:phosphate--AMP phosphotransferase [Lachnospiraceae bacterium]
MLEKIDLSRTADKKSYKEVWKEEGARLGRLQRSLKDAGIPVMILFEGMDAAGKGTQINRLIQSLDPRGFDVYASRTGEDEAMRPFLWRFWTLTPENGRIAVFDRSWYRKVLEDRFDKVTRKRELPEAFQDIRCFEKQLTDGGIVVIKLFLYISKEEQAKRFRKLEESPETEWRVTNEDRARNRAYEKYLQMNEEMLEKTDTEYAPWTIIEATDKNYAAVKILKTVTERLEQALTEHLLRNERKKQERPSELRSEADSRYQNGVLSGVDLSRHLEHDEYKKQIDALQ